MISLIFSTQGIKLSYSLTINNQLRSLAKEELKTRPGGGEKVNRPVTEKKLSKTEKC